MPTRPASASILSSRETSSSLPLRPLFAKRGICLVGVAKCHDEDVFDIEKGKDIAYNRCRLEINKFILEQDRMVEDTIKDIIKQCDEYDLGKVRSKAWDCYLDDIRGRIDQRRLFINQIKDTLNDLLK